MQLLFLHLLGGLPEEEIGADGRPIDRHHEAKKAGRPLDVRRERGLEEAQPVRLDDERRQHIGEQREGEPLQDLGIAPIGHEDLQQQDAEREENHQQLLWDGHEQIRRRRHRAKIGAHVDGVGDAQERHRDIEHGASVVATNDAGEPVVGDNAHTSAHLLHGNGQRQQHRRHPQQRAAKGRAGLRVGADARGVIVSGARDQPRSQHPQATVEIPQWAGLAAVWRGQHPAARASGVAGSSSCVAVESLMRWASLREVGDGFPRPRDTLPGKRDAMRARIAPCRSALIAGESRRARAGT